MFDQSKKQQKSEENPVTEPLKETETEPENETRLPSEETLDSEAEPVNERDQRVKELKTDIRRQVVGISHQCEGLLETLIIRYVPHISPYRAKEGLGKVDFVPMAHPRDMERAVNSRWASVLCFQITQTILAFYDYVLGQPESGVVDRLNQLKHINECGIEEFEVVGDDSHGYTLEKR